MISTFRPALSALAVPMALALSVALAGCSGSADAGSTTGASGDAQQASVAKVPPPAGKQWSAVAQRTPQGGWLVGNPDAPIKLVENGSVLCPACAHFAQTGMEPLMNDYVDSGRVSYEFRSVLIHGAADLVVVALDACGPPEAAVPRADAVWNNIGDVMNGLESNAQHMQDALQLPENQRFVAYAERGKLLDFYAGLGLSREKAKQCLANSDHVIAMANQMQKQAQADNVDHTPTFRINGRVVDAGTWDDLEPLLQRAGAR